LISGNQNDARGLILAPLSTNNVKEHVMAYISYIMSPESVEEPAGPTNVVEFPREITLQAKARSAQKMIVRCEDSIANDDPKSPDLQESLRAALSVEMLDHWRDELKEAEADLATLQASDVLMFNGRAYRADRSAAGAN
jgi:hypothetical protein